MTRKLRVLSLGCLLLLFPLSASGQNKIGANSSPFDQYGRINWEEEMKRLDRFANELRNQPQMIGYVCIQEAQISGVDYAMGHAIDITKYLIKVHNIEWNRVAWRDLGFGDSFQTTLWLYPAGQPPLYLPEYKSPTDSTFIEGAPRPAPRKRHRRHRGQQALGADSP